jgi:hypothetical protein
VGSEEISFYNLRSKEKSRRIKGKHTVGRLSLDGKYFLFAEGADWSEGIKEL